MVSKNKEDYLKAIYHLEEESKRPVKSIELAKYLKVSKPSVSKMIKKLSKFKLVSYKKYEELSLTKRGIKEAEKITYKHRIIEVFLNKMLKIGPSLIHEEGNRLEHAFSGESIEKLYLLLKNPKFCPHGKSIPTIKKKNKKW